MPTTGHYERLNGLPVVRFERTFAHPVAAVWGAITDPAQLEKWFPTTVEFSELRAGAPIASRFAQDAFPPMAGEFKEVDPLRRLVFTVVLDSEDKAARDCAGWEECLGMLTEAVAGGVPVRPTGGERWEAYYEDYKRQGVPAAAPLLKPTRA